MDRETYEKAHGIITDLKKCEDILNNMQRCEDFILRFDMRGGYDKNMFCPIWLAETIQNTVHEKKEELEKQFSTL